jgi:hypothetical protein
VSHRAEYDASTETAFYQFLIVWRKGLRSSKVWPGNWSTERPRNHAQDHHVPDSFCNRDQHKKFPELDFERLASKIAGVTKPRIG